MNVKRHKHADLIHAWAEGAEIEYQSQTFGWTGCPSNMPNWSDDVQYRIKPEKKHDVVRYMPVSQYAIGPMYNRTEHMSTADVAGDMLKLTFDGDTGNLIRAEVI